MKTCWSCKKEIISGLKECPYCSVPLERELVDRMATVVEGVVPELQIITGMVVAGRYEIKRKLGQGGMGVVYLAHDRVMAEDLAIKAVPPELSLSPVASADLKREVETCRKLNHPHIIRVHHLERWEGQTLILMEYVAGETLEHLLVARGGKLSLKEALPLLRQIALALDYSHGEEPAIVHRDLKPQNIFLTMDGKVKVADFGLARALSDSATRISRTSKAGSPAYMAPEQVMGKGVGPWSDIYALASTAYHLLAGQPPFHSGEIAYQIMEAEVEPIPGQSKQVNEALLAGLSKNPKNRPGSAGALVAMLAGETKVTAGGRGPGKMAAKQTAGKKKGLLLAVVAALLVLAGAGWYFMRGKESKPVLEVTSTPAGARFFLDDYEMGATPFVVQDLASGPHRVRLEQKRYEVHKEQVLVEQGKMARVAAALTAQPIGDVIISSTPTGAEVYVDGEKKGVTPLSLEGLAKGVRGLELRKAGYEPWPGRVEIVPLAPARVVAELSVQPIGDVNISSTPAGAEVYIDGEKKGITPLSLEGVAQGSRGLELRKENYEVWTGQVEIVPQKTARVVAELGKKKGPAAAYRDAVTGMEFVYVKGGCYQMGSPEGEKDRDTDEKQHEVCVDGFYIGKYEVTQGEWQKIKGDNPSSFKKGDNYPVEHVSWEDVQGYIGELNKQTEKNYRLPYEAEWEYAARSGGKAEKYSGGADVDAVAWYDKNSGSSTHAVGRKAANGLGIYDMSGNVWEWCQDRYGSDYYANSPGKNPHGPESGADRVIRGGGWLNDPRRVRSAFRRRNSPGYRGYYLGFRLVLLPSGQ